MNPDYFNAFFEGVGALLTWMNVVRLCRDRKVSGVYWPVTAFWSAWGAWNIAYYPMLGQWWSAAAGLVLCVGNTVWVVLAVRFTRGSAR